MKTSGHDLFEALHSYDEHVSGCARCNPGTGQHCPTGAELAETVELGRGATATQRGTFSPPLPQQA